MVEKAEITSEILHKSNLLEPIRDPEIETSCSSCHQCFSQIHVIITTTTILVSKSLELQVLATYFTSVAFEKLLNSLKVT